VKVLSGKVIDWLLEDNNPSVRFFALRDLCQVHERAKDIRAARQQIARSCHAVRLWRTQQSTGYWEDADKPYVPKYKASYWQIMICGYLGLDKADARVAKACEHIFSFQHPEGGFTGTSEEQAKDSYAYYVKKGKNMPPQDQWVAQQVFEGQMSCLTGNVVAALQRLGYASDSRVKRALDWLISVQNEDGGWLCPYWHAHIKDTHGCFYGTLWPLEACAEVPFKTQTPSIKQAIEKGAEFLLMHRLYKADHHGFKVINRSWLQLTFPWFYRYSILRALDVLTALGYTRDTRLMDAVNAVLRKRRRDGTWPLESTPTGRIYLNFGSKGQANKWITLVALRVLKRMGISS
jgi:hypothetical protein